MILKDYYKNCPLKYHILASVFGRNKFFSLKNFDDAHLYSYPQATLGSHPTMSLIRNDGSFIISL